MVWLVCLNEEREEDIKIGKYLKNVQRINLGSLSSSGNPLASGNVYEQFVPHFLAYIFGALSWSLRV